MTTNPNDPNYRRELIRETSDEGMSTAAWAGIAVAVMLVGGIAMYAFSSHESTTASTQPGAGAPSSTVGQGSAPSKMPAPKE
jgi:hypothetical protein